MVLPWRRQALVRRRGCVCCTGMVRCCACECVCCKAACTRGTSAAACVAERQPMYRCLAACVRGRLRCVRRLLRRMADACNMPSGHIHPTCGLMVACAATGRGALGAVLPVLSRAACVHAICCVCHMHVCGCGCATQCTHARQARCRLGMHATLARTRLVGWRLLHSAPRESSPPALQRMCAVFLHLLFTPGFGG